MSVVFINDAVRNNVWEAMYSRNPHIRINWNGEPSGYAENPNYWHFKVEKKILQKGCFRLHIYFHINKTLIHNSLCV